MPRSRRNPQLAQLAGTSLITRQQQRPRGSLSQGTRGLLRYQVLRLLVAGPVAEDSGT